MYCGGQIKQKKKREELMSEQGVAAARLSKRLVQIRTDLDIPPARSAPRFRPVSYLT
jgi:hypothetical protein